MAAPGPCGQPGRSLAGTARSGPCLGVPGEQTSADKTALQGALLVLTSTVLTVPYLLRKYNTTQYSQAA